jgi:hypothetical protein
MFCDDFTAYLFSIVEISWWNHSPYLSLTVHRCGSEKSRWYVKNECSKTYYSPVSGMHLTSSQSAVFSFYISKEI